MGKLSILAVSLVLDSYLHLTMKDNNFPNICSKFDKRNIGSPQLMTVHLKLQCPREKRSILTLLTAALPMSHEHNSSTWQLAVFPTSCKITIYDFSNWFPTKTVNWGSWSHLMIM